MRALGAPGVSDSPRSKFNEPLKLDDETASTASGVSPSGHSSHEEEDSSVPCVECRVELPADTPAAADGRKYCDACWLLWGGPAARAEGGPPCGGCYVVGSWDGWSTKREMAWGGDHYHCKVQLRSAMAQESFQVLAAGGSWAHRIYPNVPNAGASTPHSVLGPDPNGDGINWTIGGGAHEEGEGGAAYLIMLHCATGHPAMAVSWREVAGASSVSKMAVVDQDLDEEAEPHPDTVEAMVSCTWRCGECNVQVDSDSLAAADGTRFCEACWKSALPVPMKRIQPKRARGAAQAAAKGRQDLQLVPTFRYAGSVDLHAPLAWFDTRDEVCLRVGGFKHGEVVRESSGRELAAVGVRCVEGAPRLWFQPRDLGRPGAGTFPGAAPEVLRERLHATGRRQRFREGRLEDFDEAEDSDGEVVLLCRHCRLPVGDFAYADDQGEGSVHGECMAQVMLGKLREESEARSREAAETKQRYRAEHGLGWRADGIPRNADLAVKLGCSTMPRGLCCLVLDEDSGSVKVKETFEAAGSVNLEYLSLALQVRRAGGTEPYFSLDPVPSADALKHRTQVKRFEPDWLAGTSAGAVLFQADYHLKELSMGEYEQPVVGMKSCIDFSEDDSREKSWNAREWFVVNKADVLLSDDNVLIPRVSMGVQAREQLEGPQGITDKLVTRPDHPLVKYAEEFSKNFELIAERKSVIYNLRELAKAVVLAKFMDDTGASMEESWFGLVGTSTKGSRAEVPQIWNERCGSRIEVEGGRIIDAEDGVSKGKHGVYGGVQFGLEEAVVAGAFRQARREPGKVLPEFMTIKMPQPSRVLKGVDLDLGKFDLSAPMTAEAPEGLAGSWGSGSVGCDAAVGSAFWSNVDGLEGPLTEGDRGLLRRVFNPQLSDRRTEGEQFIPPDASASYVQRLRRLVGEEERVRALRKDHFLCAEFVANDPGPLFPRSWTASFEVARRVTSGTPCQLERLPGAGGLHVTVQELGSAAPVFDMTAEDGTRFRIYKRKHFEVRTTQEQDGNERIGAVFSMTAPARVSPANEQQGQSIQQHDMIAKATEYVRCAGGGVDGEGGPSFGLYVVLETEHGAAIVTEQRPDGTITWEESPSDLEERNYQAKVVRTADCTKSVVEIGDVKSCWAGNASRSKDAASQSRRKRYAQGVYTLASTGCHSTCSGFWQKSEGSWKLLSTKQQNKLQSRWEYGCWQAEWQDDPQEGWDASWQDGWQEDWQQEDWQQEWESGWLRSAQGARQATVAAARPPGRSPGLKQASRMRRHFEMQASAASRGPGVPRSSAPRPGRAAGAP